MRIHRGQGTEGRALIALHDVGEPSGGRRWYDLLFGWPGPAIAPDLRGHGGTEVPDGGAYSPSDFALDALLALDRAGLSPAGAALPSGAWRARRAGRPASDVLPPAANPAEWPVVVGHGWGGWAAELLAAGGRVSLLVLVDGLGGRWLSAREMQADRARWMRAVVDDNLAREWPRERPDPIFRHGLPSVWEQGFVEGVRGCITLDVLILESRSSPTPAAEREERLGAYGGKVHLEHVPDTRASTVLGALRTLSAEGKG